MTTFAGKPDRSAVEAQVSAILRRHSGADLPSGSIPPHTALIDTGFDLSSVGLLEALVEIEQALGIQLTDENLTLDVLSSFTRFMDHVCNLIPPHP